MTVTNEAAGSKAGSAAGDKRRSSLAPRLVFGGVVLALVLGGTYYWLSTRGLESTDDAYTDGTAITIAPKVAGYVVKLAVSDNTRVKAGDTILEIDPRDYLVARDKALATEQLAEAQLMSARTNLEIARVRYPADLASAEATVASAKASYAKAHADLLRQQKVDPRATTQQQVDAARQADESAAAALKDAEAKLKTAQLVEQNIATAEAQVKQLEAQVASAKADYDQAVLNLGYTHVTAPADGWVTKRNVELGNYLQPGQSLFSLVSPQVWVTANFKESQLTDMRPGQHVKIDIDAYPDLDVEGHVDSIQMGSGSRFTAFPAENATGNFVKIVQRVPVKIVIDKGLDADHPLPLGLSVEPEVEVK
ncbi:multidrug export protein EmrA [Aliidongia dinghuensis]|uniref:Multidrug export protein EmrA n=1 Tax=Aliidongia dinghuensis TaxID=1867774 RepID=A0A8J2YPM0_9PROT|nr:HlyD family secretion protein [Aliidongia dinghuensis]GGF03226.1 multidrug export protein EmrA [Aliidongia dinghuensis]